MKKYLISFIILSMLACQKNEDSGKVEIFKIYIGSENFRVIDQLLVNMEQKLEITYQSGSNAENYKSYLNSVANGVSNLKFNQNDCDILNEYRLSGMEHKYKRIDFDTVYYDKSEKEVVTVLGKDSTWVMVPNYNFIEEVIDEQRTTGRNKMINMSMLLKGFMQIAEGDSILTVYTNEVSQVSFIDNPMRMANRILRTGLDFSENYFYKLIVMREIYYTELKNFKCQDYPTWPLD